MLNYILGFKWCNVFRKVTHFGLLINATDEKQYRCLLFACYFSFSALKKCFALVKASLSHRFSFPHSVWQHNSCGHRATRRVVRCWFQSSTRSRLWSVAASGFSMEAKAFYDFTAWSKNGLSFKKGSILKVCHSNNNPHLTFDWLHFLELRCVYGHSLVADS